MVRKITLFFFISFLSISLFGQTTEVQGFTYFSTNRDTVIEFPTGDHNAYEKILMVYSMRCKDGLVSPPVSGQTNIGCGEWDYSCNTYITDSSRVDSFFSQSPTHVISSFTGDVFPYTTQPTYTYYQSTQSEIIYNNVITENEITVGAGTNDLDIPFGGNQKVTRSQLLYQADVLTTQGLQAGLITGLKIDANTTAAGFDKLRIRMKNSSQTSLENAAMDDDSFTEVYFLDSDIDAGNHFFKFHNSFTWDGVSNILVDLSYTRSGTASADIKAEVQSNVAAITSIGTDDDYLELNGSGHVTVDESLNEIQNEITIAFWNKGSDDLPISSTVFEGLDAAGLRQLNIHLPWGNGQIYWDCGNDGTGYDRINAPALSSDYKNQWNHMAFTKNATTGEMKIYINGNLFHSGNGNTRQIDVQAFSLGGTINGGRRHFGKIDDLQIWNKELSQATIQEWMNKAITPSHPDYNNLITSYTFDNAIGLDVIDTSPNPKNGTLVGTSIYRSWEGKDLKKNILEKSELPNTIFVQGEYDVTINEITNLDSLINIPNQVDEYIVTGTDLILNSTNYYYASGMMPVFDDNGGVAYSIDILPEDSITIGELEHFTKRPAKFEIMSFVTPYGINLDLGMEGKSWIFDVTDFGPILKGNKRITMERGGQWQEDNDIKFLFINGTPSRDVIDIQQVWPVTQENHIRIEDDVRFEPRKLTLPIDAETVTLKAAITGHGQQGEFNARNHYLNLDGGPNEFQWVVWKECSENPIHPQGGTWVYDRAGWCPGEATDVQEFIVTDWAYPGDEVEVDYGVLAASGDSRYIVNVQMMSYGAPNFTLDAELADIVNPSPNVIYDRYNPMCGKPKVLIKNNGATTITSLDITYSVDGVSPKTYTWTGSLVFLETKEVELPLLDAGALATPNSTFYATVSNPNGGVDEYANNDEKSTGFEIVPTFATDIVIRMKTNLAANETTYRVYDDNGNTVFNKGFGLSANTTYSDTLFGLNGCYRVEFTDSDEDGIAWWANNDGNGFIQIKSVGDPFITLEPDFGKFLNYGFIAGDITPTQNLTNQKILNIYPNPSADIFHAELEGYIGDVLLEIVNPVGQILESIHLEKNSNDFIQQQFDLSDYSSGIYLLKIQHENVTEVKKLIKL